MYRNFRNAVLWAIIALALIVGFNMLQHHA
jgi:hypothetical protein